MRARWNWIGIAGIAVLAAGGGILLFQRHHRSPPAPVVAPPPRPASLTLTGKISAQHVVPVPVPIEGVIDQMLVQVGQEVIEGQLLARVRSGALEGSHEAIMLDLKRGQDKVNALEAQMTAARLEASRTSAVAVRAAAIAERAERDYLRQSRLNAEGATPRLVYEQSQRDNERAQADWKAAQSVADQASRNVERLAGEIAGEQKLLDGKNQALEQSNDQIAAGDVVAPVDGIVVAIHGEAGSSVNPSMASLMEIGVDVSLLEVELEAPPETGKLVAPDMPATVQVLELGAQPIPATVKAVEPGRIVVAFLSPAPLVKPGLTAQVTIPVH